MTSRFENVRTEAQQSTVPASMPVGVVSATFVNGDGTPFREVKADALMHSSQPRVEIVRPPLPNTPSKKTVGGGATAAAKSAVPKDDVQSTNMLPVPKFIRNAVAKSAKKDKIEENAKTWSDMEHAKVLNADVINDKIYNEQQIFQPELIYILNRFAQANGMYFSYDNIQKDRKALQWAMSADVVQLNSGKSITFTGMDNDTLVKTFKEMTEGMWVPKPLALLLGVVYCHRPYTTVENNDLSHIQAKFEKLYVVMDEIEDHWIVDWVNDVIRDEKLRDDTLVMCNRYIFDSIMYITCNKTGYPDMSCVINKICDMYRLRTAKFIEHKNQIPDQSNYEKYTAMMQGLTTGFTN